MAAASTERPRSSGMLSTAEVGVPPRRLELLILSDSLAFHGPGLGELTTEARLWPNVLARALEDRGRPAHATIFGRRGWTARDAWFALTRDPHVYSVLLPAADVVVLAVGGMDYLPAVMPSHLREGLRLLRPRPLRAAATAAFRRAQPVGARLLNGRWRNLPQPLTDHYLRRCVAGIRHFHPSTLVLGVTPPPHAAPGYGRVTAGHAKAVAAARRWAGADGVPLLDFDRWVAGFIGTAEMNPDGIHWGWQCHRLVGMSAAEVLARQLAEPPAPTG
jgi:hypothetical protein